VSSKDFLHAGGPTEDALFDWMAGRLHPEAGEWIADHVEGCARCAQAVRRVEAVRSALEPPEVSPFQRLRDLTAVRRRLEQPSHRLPWLAVSSGFACVVLAFMLFFGWKRLHAPGPAVLAQAPVAAHAAEVPWSILYRSGAVEVKAGSAHPAQANEEMPAGGVLSVQPGAHVLSRWGGARILVDGGASGAQVRLVASRTNERTLALERGRVLLDVDPLKPGVSLAVVTADARVTVHGTVFLVDAQPAGTRVAVTRGLVRVASRDRTVDVGAGSVLEPKAPAPVAIDAEARGALERLTGAQAPVAHPPAESVEPKPARPAAEKIERETGDPLADARADVMGGRYDRAIERLQAFRKHATATQAARAGLLEAQAWRLSLRAQQAVPILRKVAGFEGAEAEQAQLLLAQTLARDLSDAAGAAEAYAEAQRRFPSGIFKEEVAFRLGETLLDAAQPREGVAALERYLATWAEGAHADDAHLLIATARRDRLNDCAGAIPHFHAVAGPVPLKSARAEVALIGEARCLAQVGRAAEARAAFSRYVEERPRGRFSDEARTQSSSAKR
jgi:ferric-dicitrate binding protein FerR (iron transport regulator)